MRKVSTHIVALAIYLIYYQAVILQYAVGAEMEDEPRISLSVKNQPLGSVLSRISQDTGVEFSLDDKWSSYPINDTLQNVPLHQGLKLILRGLNHAIIYESSTSIRIVVYDEADSRSSNTYYSPPIPPPVQYNEPPPPPEPPDEETEETNPSDDSPAESESKENTEEKSDEDTSDDASGKKEEIDEQAAGAEKE